MNKSREYAKLKSENTKIQVTITRIHALENSDEDQVNMIIASVL